MADFNSDNSKIDAALKANADAIAAEATARQAAITSLSQTMAGKASAADVTALENQVGLKVIKSVTVPSGSTMAVIDLADIDWENWKIVHLLAAPAADSPNLQFCLNSVTTYAITTISTVRSLIRFYTMFNADMPVSGHVLGLSPSTFGYGDLSYQKIDELLVRTLRGETIPAGGQLVFYGEK